MKTDFVPKLVASISACCAVYAAVTVADRLLAARTLASVGYFDALVGASLLLIRHELSTIIYYYYIDNVMQYDTIQ